MNFPELSQLESRDIVLEKLRFVASEEMEDASSEALASFSASLIFPYDVPPPQSTSKGIFNIFQSFSCSQVANALVRALCLGCSLVFVA